MDFFVDTINAIHVRGPILRIETVVNLPKSNSKDPTQSESRSNGDVIMTLDTAKQLCEALVQLIEASRKDRPSGSSSQTRHTKDDAVEDNVVS